MTTGNTPGITARDNEALRRTALHGVHVAAGATMTSFAGWSMPVRYGSDLAEHRAVRQRAGLFDLGHMGQVDVTGPEAAAALDYALVSHLSAVAVGRARYTMLCAPEGGVLDDLVVYRRDDTRFLVVANAANTARVVAELEDRCADFDVAIDEVTSASALVAIQGPIAVEVLRRLGVADAADVAVYAGRDVWIGGVPVWLARTGYTGEDGFELFVAAEAAELLWEALAVTGADDGVVACGLACRDTLRLEAGMPLYGHELTEDRDPFAAGLGRVVAFDKGAFVGRDALRQAADAPAAQRRVGLRGQGRRAPRAGNEVIAGDDGPVGTVTSGALSPTLGVPIAMAYVRSEVAEVGRRFAVDVRGTPVDVEVVTLPFLSRR